VQVGAADTAHGDAHQHLAAARLPDRPILDPQILRRMNYDRAHRELSQF
jgi:hypothetical protein